MNKVAPLAASGFHGIPRIHGASGVEAVGTEFVCEIDGGCDFMHIEPSRGIVDLDRHAGLVESADARHLPSWAIAQGAELDL